MKLNFASSFFSKKGQTVEMDAGQFEAECCGCEGTWFEVFTDTTGVKPYFDMDLQAEAASASAAAAAKAAAVAFLLEHFPEATAVNCCQRVKPGKISYHFTLSGMRTTPAALLQRLKAAQGGQNNSPFDLKPYMAYQKWNAPGQSKLTIEGGGLGPVMEVQDGDVKANLVAHLEGDEALCLWGWKPQPTLDGAFSAAAAKTCPTSTWKPPRKGSLRVEQSSSLRPRCLS